jgi:hypothetical protein
MFKKIMQVITGINQILLFIAAALFIMMMLPELVRSRRNDSDSTGVELVSSTNQPAASAEKIVVSLKFSHVVDELYVFCVRSQKIDSSMKYRDGMSTKGMGKPYGPEPHDVNLLFVREDQSSYMLFEHNCLVLDYNWATLRKRESWDRLMTKNLYSVVAEDSNGDGFLSGDDRVDLYESNPNGTGLKRILGDVTGREVIRDNELMITQGEGSERVFYLYNVAVGKLIRLDVHPAIDGE